MGRFPGLISERSSLTTDRPSKTVGSYWTHATTLYDYIYRAMPFGNAQSLTPDEVYGLTAYILAMNSIIAEDEVMNAETLPKVNMPNRDGFIVAGETDIKVDACMQDCVDEVKITSRASRNNVTQESGE
jgi:cytochrome c